MRKCWQMENQFYWTQERTEILEQTTTSKFLYKKEFLGKPKNKGDKIKTLEKSEASGTNSHHKHQYSLVLYYVNIKLDIKGLSREFLAGPVAKTLHSQNRGPGLIPGQGTRSHIPQLRPYAAK